jgi:NF-kappa-B inhibitor-like protein 2
MVENLTCQGDHEDTATVSLSLLGLFEQAIEEHEMELQLSESLSDTIAVAIAHRKIGECLCELHDFKQALFHQQKHLEVI